MNVPDWMRCIICHVFARNGVVRHARTCAEYVPPRRDATTVRVGDLLRRK